MTKSVKPSAVEPARALSLSFHSDWTDRSSPAS
jgi:hypothetical protein